VLRATFVRVVVTGGAGFIGSHLVRRFATQGSDVTVLDNLSRPGATGTAAALAEMPRVRVEPVDIRAADDVATVVREARPDVVAHLAAQTAVTGSLADPTGDFEVNARGTLHLLEALRESAADALVLYASTNKVYGGLSGLGAHVEGARYLVPDRPDGIDEEEPFAPETPYGCSKATADLYVREYSARFGIRGVVFRQSCIYGPYDVGLEDQGWVVWLVSRVCRQQPVNIFGDGFQVRDLLWIEDLLDLYERVIEHPGTAIGEAFNIGGGRDFSLSVWGELAPLMSELLGREIAEPAYLPWRPGDQSWYASDIRKASAAWSWRPACSPRQGLEVLVERFAEALAR
jgi:CDP-paratose 2-epimerase